MATPPPPSLDKMRHVRYWLRCLKSCLPADYIATDLNRMTLGCFCVAALDLLGELPSRTSPEDRQGWVEWVYRNQLPDTAPGGGGGFRGSPATDFGDELRTASNQKWDPPNLPGSFFAVATLVGLGDDLARVKRRELLALLPKLQRKDGSFEENFMHETEAGLGDDAREPAEAAVVVTDMRFVYMAAALRWMLRGQHGNGCPDVPDFDVQRTVRYIKSSQSYDCGVSEKPFGESHGMCALCWAAVRCPSCFWRVEGNRWLMGNGGFSCLL